MPRITGGELCGRRAVAPKTLARPTQARVREALFAILGPRVAGCRFLDLFAGSGMVGLEAWSRGAAAVTMVERDRRACETMLANIAGLRAPDAAARAPRVVRDTVERFLRRARSLEPDYDLVFADPPYGGDDRWEKLLGESLNAAGLPVAGGLWILESGARGRRTSMPPPPWEVLSDRVYGDTRLSVYRNSMINSA